MDFRSDNVRGAHPRIMEALARANVGPANAYGDDAITARVTERLSSIFEHDVAVFIVATGTAANALSLSLVTPPWGAIFCHEAAHVQTSECGAPEFYTAGAKLVGVRDEGGKVTPAALEAAIDGIGAVHAVEPAALSLSQATESGTVYGVDELSRLTELARRRGMSVHMDGARFANALVSIGATPAAMTWKAGIDVLSFGATKNGCCAAEAVIVFDPAKALDAQRRRKRAGMLLSKMRFVSAQLDAYLEDELWLANARHANAAAQTLAGALRAAKFELILPVDANEVFVRFPDPLARELRTRGFLFHDWPALGQDARRLVTAFDTREEDLTSLVVAVGAQ